MARLKHNQQQKKQNKHCTQKIIQGSVTQPIRVWVFTNLSEFG